MLKIFHPNYCSSEWKYIIHVIMSEYLGLDYFLAEKANLHELVITLGDKSLSVNDSFFFNANKAWLSKESLPQQPLDSWDSRTLPDLRIKTTSPKIPVIYGSPLISFNEGSCRIGLDILGSAFFMLSRYEEGIKSQRDQYDRFPATASLAFQEGFLSRPIVNEYVEVLWACMKKLWPNIQRKNRNFEIIPTHDVDIPFCFAGKSLVENVRFIASEALNSRRFGSIFPYLLKIPIVKSGFVEIDPFNTFEWLMDVSEKNGIRSSFFFIADHSGGNIDGDYSLEQPLIQSLITEIHRRGHHVGLHGSFNSYLDQHQALKERDIFFSLCENMKIEQSEWGVRQHILRWKTPETFVNWNTAGIDYDTTLCFADHPGFRCGTCYEYSAFDIIKRTILNIKEKPLIAMDASVVDKKYMNLGYSEKAFEVFRKLKEVCRQFNGQFILLWHNSRLLNEQEKLLYKSIITS